MSRSLNLCKRPPAFLCLVSAFVVVYVVYGLRLVPNNNSHLDRPKVPRMRLPALGPRPANFVTAAMKYTQEEMERVMLSQEARRAVEPRDLMLRLREMSLEPMQEENSVRKKGDLVRPRKDVGDSFAGSRDMGEASGPITQQGRFYQRKETQNELEGGKLVLKGPEIEDGIIPGRPLPAECNAEPHTDYDGLAVKWGLTHPQESAADCCQACLRQARSAKEGELRCNLWVYCPAEEGCFSPDIYQHKQFECWLKQAETPKINFKGRYPPDYREAHPTCPHVVAWAAGVIS